MATFIQFTIRVECRRGRYGMTPINLNDAVEEYLESPGCLRLTESCPQVEVKIALDRSIRPILGSSFHLMKVIMNLIVNAFDAMPGGGRQHFASSYSIARAMNGRDI